MRRSAVLTCLSRGVSGRVKKEMLNSCIRLCCNSRFHLDRNSFLKAAAVGALGDANPCPMHGYQSLLGHNYSIGIVGAGLAGRTTAYLLQKKGISTTIYESSHRAGGRVLTLGSPNAEERFYEAGGEFIGSNHETIKRLCKEFGVGLIDTIEDAESQKLIPQDYLIDGVRYSAMDVMAAFASSAPRVAADLEACGKNYDTDDAARLDNTSLTDYVNTLPMNSWLKSLLVAAYEAEYGLTGACQSSLNFINMISSDIKQGFSLYGDSGARFRIEGGSSQIVQALVGHIGKSIQYGKSVAEVNTNGKHTFIRFVDGSSASHHALVIAIPFSVLREMRLNIPMMSKEKKRCINELTYGNNCKIVLPFSARSWRKFGSAGNLVSETIQNGWDATQGQANNNGFGLYTAFLGAEPASILNNADVASAENMAKQAVSILNAAYPGSEKDYLGGYELSRWQTNQLSKGSYPAYSVGQWTSISGYEAEPTGNVFFAGDHTSDVFQGCMNGAVESGERASNEITEYLHRAAKSG